MTPRHLASAVLAGLTLTVALAPAASAAPQPDHVPHLGPGAVRHDGATTRAQSQRIKDYWTPERMSAALPADGALATGEDAAGVSVAAPATRDWRHGLVYYSMSGVDYSCSGTVTQSQNHDVVTTAGHCVTDGAGTFATNWTFLPAYENNTAYAILPAVQLFTTQQWANRQDYAYDVGFAVLEDVLPGLGVTDSGAYPIAFDVEPGRQYTMFGYPSQEPFTGQHLYSCSGTGVPDDSYGTTDDGLVCDMTAGASGGGWISDGSLTAVSSRRSYEVPGEPDRVWGVRFGDVVKAVYDQASTWGLAG